MTAITVAPSRGHAWPLAAATAALTRSVPRCMRTTMLSDTKQELSTIMPMAMISAPSDMRCRSMPNTAMAANVPRMMNISIEPMMRPIFSPLGMIKTTSTMPTAISKLSRNALIDSLTKSDCQAILCSSIPIGRSRVSSSSRRSIFAPVSTTLPPAALAA